MGLPPRGGQKPLSQSSIPSQGRNPTPTPWKLAGPHRTCRCKREEPRPEKNLTHHGQLCSSCLRSSYLAKSPLVGSLPDFSSPSSQTHSPYSTLLTLALGWGLQSDSLTKLPEELRLQDSKEGASGNAWGYISLNILPSPDWCPPPPPTPLLQCPPLYSGGGWRGGQEKASNFRPAEH